MIGDFAQAIVVTALLSIPLALSVWALLDCARRPAWAWALTSRRQVVWMAAILVGTLAMVCGIAISLYYLLRIRPEIAAAEQGRFRST